MVATDAQRILIVDDDPGVRGYLRAALVRTGHEVVEAGTAAEAMAAIEAAPVGVLLIDGLLPDGHGLDLAAQVLERPEGARMGISFVTGAVREPVPPVHGIGALGKPVRPSELIAGVNELLQWHAGGTEDRMAERRATLESLAARFLVGR
ncbi:MAG: two-component system response regulator [Candidatus Dormibacteria bacterium]